MRERGVVVGIRGDKAVVKVLTPTKTGCCCGSFYCSTFEEVEVQNRCGAKKDDWVLFDSERDQKKNRSALQTAGSFTVFCLAVAAGQIAAAGIWLSLGMACAAGVLAFLAIERLYRRRPLIAAVAGKIIPPPAELPQEKAIFL